MLDAETKITIKPLGGIAGDMFAGACAALWPDLVDSCLQDVRAAGLPEGVSVAFEDVLAHGFAARRFVVQDAGPVVPSGAYPDIAARLAGSTLERTVEAEAQAILSRLAEAEAEVHGKSVEMVHFHELADWDSLADIVAAASFIVRSGVQTWAIDPLPLGGGTVQTQHGRITVPAPAVLVLLRGFDMHEDGIVGERVTPTGAAIAAHLCKPDPKLQGAGRLLGAGFGAGTKKLPGMANVVQLLAFSQSAVNYDDHVTALSFDIDDMTGEELGAACDLIRGVAGVLDVSLTSMHGKKGRPSQMVRILVRPEHAETALQACFEQTSTLGVRIAQVQRRILARKINETTGHTVKIAHRPTGFTAKAEADGLTAPTLSARRREKADAEGAALSLAEEEPS